MRIALDAMGSDGAPDVEVAGAVAASLADETEILLVGHEEALAEKLTAFSKRGNVRVIHASEAIGMHEPPVMAVRKKKDASLLVAMRLVKEGEADAVVSAGNTGAVMVAARTVLGPMRGIVRSAISQCLPTEQGDVVVLDLGANVDCTVRQLCEFAEMGMAYAHFARGVENPRVALLNIGEEGVKGSQVAREVHAKLSAAPDVNFIGNVEPQGIFRGEADVVVCDGFVGNLFLKTSEAAAELMGRTIRAYLLSSSMSRLGGMLAHKALNDMRHRFDPNEFPGAPLLGINGLVIILHGSCNQQGVGDAIEGARVAHESRLNDHIRENIERLRAHEPGDNGKKTFETPADAPVSETGSAE